MLYTMPYSCLICKEIFNRKQNYERHLKTVKHLKRVEKNNMMFTCEWCTKSFSQSSSLISHQKRCEMLSNNLNLHTNEQKIIQNKNTQIQIQENQIKEQQLQIENLQRQVSLLFDKVITTNHIHNQNNIETQNIIVVNSFGNENIDYLTDKTVCRIIQTAPFESVPQLIEKIHFDPDHPENHNIKITNKKMNYAEIIKNNKWVTANKKEVIDNVIQNSYHLLDEKFIDNKDTITQKRQERFENFQEKFQEEDEEIMKNIKNQVDLILINGTNNVHK